jgi:hypothetical protein
MYLGSANQLNFSTDSVNRFRINSVGFSIFSTNVMVDKNFNYIFDNLDNADNGAIVWRNADGTRTTTAQITSISDGSFARKAIGFFTKDVADWTTAATEKMRITALGNLHIGTFSADSGEKLQVTGTAKITGNVQIGSTAPTIASGYTSVAVGNATNGGNIDLFTGATRVASWNNTSTETYFGTRTNTPLIFTVNASEAARFLTSGNLRFPNLKGVVFLQTGGTLLGSIGMDSGNQVTIDNNGFFGLSVGTNYNLLGGNTGIGTNTFGTSATRTFAMLNGTAPSSSPADTFQMYSNDVTAGNAAPHFRTENGAVIKLYQQDNGVAAANYVSGIGSAVTTLDAFDGYTIGQVVKALRNAGILS